MERRRKSRRWLWVVVIVVALGGGVLFIRSRLNEVRANFEAQQLDAGDTVEVFIGDLSTSATASGQVLPQREASLSVTSPGRVEQVHVRVGDAVQMGDVLLKLATADLQLNVANAQQTLHMREANLASLQETASEADMVAAEAAVASAQANLDDLLAGPSAEEIVIAEANLRSAEASVLSSSADLGSAQNTIKASQIEAAQAALLSAQMSQDRAQEINEDNPTQQTHEALQQANQALADAQARLDDLLAGPDTAVSANSLSAANARFEGSEADLNVALSGTSAAQIASAEAQSAQAQASLADLMEGATAQQIQTAEAEIEQARISLADAAEALAKATLVAPFAGIVTAVNVSEGEFASGVVIQLVDHNSLEVILEVDEVDVGELSIGQAATINLETWPEAEIASEVVSIAPIANTDPGSALVTYEVHLSLGETDLPVRVGMTANANLITAQFEDVLLVPNRAIKVDRAAGEYSVLLLTTDADGTQTSTEVPITIGLRDGENTQVTDGLQAGDELLIESSVPSLDFTPPGFNAGD